MNLRVQAKRRCNVRRCRNHVVLVQSFDRSWMTLRHDPNMPISDPSDPLLTSEDGFFLDISIEFWYT
jgi:hypothetical protein